MTQPQSNAFAMLQKAFTLHEVGQFEQAAELYHLILQDSPAHHDAALLLGLLALKVGNPNVAVHFLGKAVTINPNQSLSHFQLGNGLRNLKQYEAALASYDRALELTSDSADIHFHRAHLLVQMERYLEALVSFETAICICPTHAEAWVDRGNALGRLNRYDEALKSYDQAICLKPDYSLAHNNRGVALKELKRDQEALDSYDHALRLCPDFAEALSNRSIVLRKLHRLDEALHDSYQARQLAPHDYVANNNYANALRDCHDYANALMVFRHIQLLAPQRPEGHLGEFFCLFTLGDIKSAWPKHEWRPANTDHRLFAADFNLPQWKGIEPLNGKTILLLGEQGFGDIIQFCRYAPMVAALGATVLLVVPAELKELMRTLPNIAQIIAYGEALPQFDYFCPLLSLPLVFNTEIESIPATVPYLHSGKNRHDHWAQTLGPKTGLRVGLAWSGNPAHSNDANRSIGLRMLTELIAIKAQFICLQKNINAADLLVLNQYPHILNYSDAINDFRDTAALIDHMDLVISVDTSVAHLAGALGKPVWILLPNAADWRWFVDRNDSPWYPSARLIRQQQAGDWMTTISSIKRDLQEFCEITC